MPRNDRADAMTTARGRATRGQSLSPSRSTRVSSGTKGTGRMLHNQPAAPAAPSAGRPKASVAILVCMYNAVTNRTRGIGYRRPPSHAAVHPLPPTGLDSVGTRLEQEPNEVKKKKKPHRDVGTVQYRALDVGVGSGGAGLQ
jgi:hypothetical protein